MLSYDWDDTMSEERLRADLVNDKGEPFDFRGPGWYMEKDVCLILENPFAGGFFDIYVWNAPDFDPRDRMQDILNLPLKAQKE